MRSISELSLFLRTQKTCHHLEWLVPKLLEQIELSASDILELVIKALISIFQNFIKIKETNHDHLKELREMIISSAIKVLDFFYRKGDTFEIQNHQIGVLVALGKRVREKLNSIIQDGLKNNFFSVKSKVAETYLMAYFMTFPEESTKVFVNWINQKVIEKIQKPESVGI